jgi:hypothetical protein
MASNFPKLPGYVPLHDPTHVDHKKVSHVKLEQIRNAKNLPVPLYSLPRMSAAATSAARMSLHGGKPEEHKSLSQTQFSNPFGKGDIAEQFEPTWVKLDKQVSLTRRYNLSLAAPWFIHSLATLLQAEATIPLSDVFS